MSSFASLISQIRAGGGGGGRFAQADVSALRPLAGGATPQAPATPVTPDPPYLAFNKQLNPMDLGSINQQQSARNTVFTQFLSSIEGMLGSKFNTQQSAANQSYMQPITATFGDKAFTQYHYDMFGGNALKAAQWLSGNPNLGSGQQQGTGLSGASQSALGGGSIGRLPGQGSGGTR